ncbi:MAG: response regulator transcription factor [candidate division WS1 bacterium]|jgi:FixJ family two-component response regulator|nr:response regulator transcription factor [candidate division WS1 bacterium]
MSEDTAVHIVDDDASVLRALERLLRAAGYDSRTYSSATEFLQAERPEGPSCLVLDVDMPEMTGLDLQAELNAKGKDLPIIFITGYGDIPTSVRAMKAGAVDFLPKPFTDEQLLEAVETALRRDATNRNERQKRRALEERLERLTKREQQVMALVVTGRLNKQIATELGIKEKTVKIHRGRVMDKLEVGSLAELVRLATRAGLVPG